MTDRPTEATPLSDPTIVAKSLPPLARLALEIPKPKNWQDFQRACVELYRAELNDPHPREYGRQGQDQKGIDILGRRSGRGSHYVGIQCRLVKTPLKRKKIEEDCRAALAIEAGLKEIVFATTAPDDTTATDAAISVEKQLASEGHDITVALYGWDALQQVIARWPEAAAFFHPGLYAPTADQPVSLAAVAPELTTQLAAILAALPALPAVQGQRLITPPADAEDRSAEDPPLHAKIDLLRDLFQKDRLPLLAKRQLTEMLGQVSADDRPWAVYRLETNLGSIAMDLGREIEAADHFVRAYELRPDDANAVANLSLARTLQGKPDEGMDLARQALSMTPRADLAVAYLLQAAARAEWTGDPEKLIPDDLKDSNAAAFGLAEYLRRRDVPGWAQRTIELLKQHPESEELRRASGVAILELAVSSQAMLIGDTDVVSLEQIGEAADHLQSLADHYLDIGYEDQHDLLAYVNNAAVLLRMVDREAEAEALLQRGVARLPDEPSLKRLLALAQWALGKNEKAIVTLTGVDELESSILRAEMLCWSDREKALQAALAIVVPSEEIKLTRLRFRMLGDLGLRMHRADIVEQAIAGLRAGDADPLLPDLLAARQKLSTEPAVTETDEGDETEENQAAELIAIADRVAEDTNLVLRYEIAETLQRNGIPEIAVRLLEGHVDLKRPGLPASLYLSVLAEARLDDRFEKALADAAPAVRQDPDILWMIAAREWNRGDLDAALLAADDLIAAQPENARARLLRLDILARNDRTAELATDLEQPLETMEWGRIEDQARVASFLAHFGQIDRAIAFSYRLFLTHTDTPRAWLALSGIIMGVGRNLEDRRWEVGVVGNDAAVDIEYEDGTTRFFVIEPDASLRKIDPQAFEPHHPLAVQLAGASVGTEVIDGEGRHGTISKVRHKYVARFHYVIENFQARFPGSSGFRRIVLGPEAEDTIAAVRAEAKARQEWIDQEQRGYLEGSMPLALLAYRVGADVTEAAGGIAASGEKIKVALGSDAEVALAKKELAANGLKGLTLDLLTFWTAWRIKALDALTATFGPIHVPPSVVDRLRARRDSYEESSRDGLRLAGYQNGELVITDHTAQEVVDQRNDVEASLEWLREHGRVVPITVSDRLPEILRDSLRRDHAEMFDALALSIETDTVLLSDDLFTRDFSHKLCQRRGVWLQGAMRTMLARGTINLETYTRWMAHLIGSGQSYIGVDGDALSCAARLDSIDGSVPGYFLTQIASVLGGKFAEPRSHLSVVISALQILWNADWAYGCREAATGHILRQLVSSRHDDHLRMLRHVWQASRNAPGVRAYFRGWLQGHFISFEAMMASGDGIAIGRKTTRKARTRATA